MMNLNNSGRQRCSGPSRQRRRPKNIIWSDEQLKSALDDVDNGMSMRQASIKHGIPYSFLRDWCYGIRTSRKRGPPPIFNPVEEQLIVDYLLSMCDLGYGLTPIALRLKVAEITKDR